MLSSTSLKRDWLSNPRQDLLAGLVVALALIPEAIGFSIIAGVDPRVGLYASFTIAVLTSVFGGRPGMISAATAAIAVLIGPLVRDHGLEYLFAATILMGIVQFAAGLLRIDRVMQFVSRSVVTGFVNALAILIFMAQLPELTGDSATLETYGLVALGLAVIYLFPRVTKSIPSPLVAILTCTAITLAIDLPVRRVGDMGALPDALPFFALPKVPLTLETLEIILPYSVTMAAVGLIESLLTAQIVDDLTDTPSDKGRETRGQGIANFVTGFFGGMGGCAMIGQSVINVKSGGHTRLSSLVAGSCLMLLVTSLGFFVARIPMPALVAVMVMVSIGTFSWASIKNLRTHPWQSSTVMATTVVVVVATHDLAQGVLAGVLLSGVFFASKVRSRFQVTSELSADGQERHYVLRGEVFYASVDRFVEAFDFREVLETVTIDVDRAHFWDLSAVHALDRVLTKFRREGTTVTVIGVSEVSANMIERFGTVNPDENDGIDSESTQLAHH
ncbi:MAG: SulP family inorganic anion transporter [Planctomycetota bacterium]